MRFVKFLWTVAVIAGALTIVPAAGAAPPANDDFANAAPLGDVPFVVRGTVAEATVEPDEPQHGVRTVWCAIQASRTGRVALTVTNAPEMDPRISVYTGSALPALAASPLSQGPLPIRVAFDVVAGETYRVAVAHYHCTTIGGGFQEPIVECDERGSRFTLRGELAPVPPNDAISHATVVRVPGAYAGDLRDATSEPGEGTRFSHSLWYRFRPRETTKITINLGAAGYDCTMRLYRGRVITDLELVRLGSGVTGDAPAGPMRLTVHRNDLYHLALGCDAMDQSEFVLTLSEGTINTEGIELALNPPLTADSLRKRGLHFTVTGKRRARVGMSLRISRKMARRFGLTSRVLGSATRVLNPRRPLRATLRLTRAARRSLTDGEIPRFSVRLELLAGHGPNRVLTLPVRL